MIKFFRKIRQRLVDEKRLGKYLLYAMGEIVLVVIGILIALQINNWNEKQKELRNEHSFLIEFSNALEYDSKHFMGNVNELERQLKIIDQLILEANDSIAPVQEYPDKLGYLRWIVFFRPIAKENHADEMNQILNQEIKASIIDYFRAEEYVRESVYEYRGIIIDKLRTFLANNGILNSMSVLEEDIEIRTNSMIKPDKLKEQLKTQEFDQILFETRLKTFEAKKELQDLINRNQALSLEITNSLRGR